MHSGKLVCNKRSLEHETQTKMLNGIQISNLESLIKSSLPWMKALGYYRKNHHTWLPSICIIDLSHNLASHKNGTRIDFNYHLILTSGSCQKCSIQMKPKIGSLNSFVELLRTIDCPVNFLVFSLLLVG